MFLPSKKFSFDSSSASTVGGLLLLWHARLSSLALGLVRTRESCLCELTQMTLTCEPLAVRPFEFGRVAELACVCEAVAHDDDVV